MRDLHIANLDKARPVVVLTRETVRPMMRRVTVAPITSTAKGLSTEVALSARNGLDGDCVASCDNIITIESDRLGRHIGYLYDDQEAALARAVLHAFDLRVPDPS